MGGCRGIDYALMLKISCVEQGWHLTNKIVSARFILVLTANAKGHTCCYQYGLGNKLHQANVMRQIISFFGER